MSKAVTREDVLKAIENVEHPEIAATLIDLGMILDVSVEGNQANIALALPMLGIPEAVLNAIVQNIHNAIQTLDVKMRVALFEMTPEARERFFEISRSHWKGAI